MGAHSKNRTLIATDKKRRKDPEVTVNPGTARNEPDLSIQDSTCQSKHRQHLFLHPAKYMWSYSSERIDDHFSHSQMPRSGPPVQGAPLHSLAANICQDWLNADAAPDTSHRATVRRGAAFLMDEKMCCVSRFPY